MLQEVQSYMVNQDQTQALTHYLNLEALRAQGLVWHKQKQEHIKPGSGKTIKPHRRLEMMKFLHRLYLPSNRKNYNIIFNNNNTSEIHIHRRQQIPEKEDAELLEVTFRQDSRSRFKLWAQNSKLIYHQINLILN